ncbi:amine dehydrogenase [Pseudomonas jessenii]|uniref:Amine dehydrogenase n=1 Tax=Pseudomonas jessenii TaxID=77298 RepID=A0A2W0EXB7_PSEJE|nr:amine dehydrogenase large subunit [Pseudomonas jessenii]PYY72467.1 amine dehydrogenase [Pseudomonas jessenii]
MRNFSFRLRTVKTVRCFVTAIVLGLGSSGLMAQTISKQPNVDGANQPLAIETASVAELNTDKSSMVFLPDLTSGHLLDTRVHVVDGKSMKFLGIIPTGMVGLFTVNPVRDELYVATTYLSRGTRGKRTDVVEVYSAKNLRLLEEIEILPKRAQAVPYASYLKTSRDGNLLYVQNITPASSIVVIDIATRRVISEIETSGCAGIYPSPSALRFSTLCGDGAAVTVTLDNDGKELSRTRSNRLFDPSKDPVFISGAATEKGFMFISFNGTIHEVDLSGPTAIHNGSWSLLSGTEKDTGWRPGGYQTIAFDQVSKELFVTMHADGKEGSHKRPSDEIWRIDTQNRKVTERIPSFKSVSLGVTQGEKPALFALNGETGGLIKFKVDRTIKQVNKLDAPLVEGPTTLIMPQ